MKMAAIVKDKINETQLNCLPKKNNGRYSILFNRSKKYFQAQSARRSNTFVRKNFCGGRNSIFIKDDFR
mgnify:CR=1 FL=1